MPSTPNLDISSSYDDNAPSATQRLDAAQLDSDHRGVEAWANEDLLPALAKVIRDDDTLADQIVRLRNLHPELSAAIASAAGWQPKESVACASTANLTLSGEQTIDGVATNASRVLVKNQTATAENGIYVTAAGSWARAADADSDAELEYAFVAVLGGTANGSTSWVVTHDTITVGTTSITWAQVGGTVGPLPISKGGTGASTASGARSNIGISDAMAPVVGSSTTELAIAAMGPFDTALVSVSDGTEAITLTSAVDSIKTVEALGAIGDGTWHPLSELFSTLAEAQAVYPHAADLNQSIDWAALQAAANAGGTWRMPGRYNVTNPITVTKNGTRFIGLQGAGDPDSTSSPITRIIVTYWRGLADGGVYDALLTLRNPLGGVNDTIQGCVFEHIYFDPGNAPKDAAILEQCYNNQFTSCWFGSVQCTLASNGASIRFKKYSGTNRFLNCYTTGVKAVVFEEYDVNTYHLYNTFTNFRIFGGVFGIDMRAGCIGNTFTNLMCDLTSLSTFAAYGGTVPGVPTKSDVRGIKIHPDGAFGAFPGNTFNSVTNADFENTEAQGTALDYVGTQALIINFSVSAGYASQFSATATGMRIKANAITYGQHIRPSGCERWLNGFFEGASEDGTISWASNWRSNAITRDNTYKQFTFPWQKTIDGGNAKIDELQYHVSSDIGTIGHKAEIISLSSSGTSPSVEWSSGDLTSAPGGLSVTPNLSLSNAGRHYYIRISVKGTGGSFLYLHPLRVIHTGIGE